MKLKRRNYFCGFKIQTFILLILVSFGCTPASSDSNNRNKESSSETDQGKNSTEETPENEGGENVTNVPVPIFLVDPDGIQAMSDGVTDLNSNMQFDVDKLASNELKDQQTKNSETLTVLTSNGYFDLIKDIKLIVSDQFGGTTLPVPNGSHIFVVSDDIVAKSTYLPRLAKVEVLAPTNEFPEHYKMTLFCALGLPNGSVKECARVEFRPSDQDKSKGIVDIIGRVKAIQTDTIAAMVIQANHVTNRLVGGVRDIDGTSFEVGFAYSGTYYNGSHVLRYVNKIMKPAAPLNLGIFDNLTRSRDHFLNRVPGDLVAFESAEYKDQNIAGRLQTNAFIPVEELGKFSDGILPRTILDDYSLYLHAKRSFYADFQNPNVNLDCALAGKIMRDIYGIETVPEKVANLPDSLCASTGIDVNIVESGLEQTCADGKSAEFQIKISKNTGPFSVLTTGLCGILPSLKQNPRYFEKVSLANMVPVPDYLLKLNAELSKEKDFISLTDTIGLLGRYDLSSDLKSIGDVQ